MATEETSVPPEFDRMPLFDPATHAVCPFEILTMDFRFVLYSASLANEYLLVFVISKLMSTGIDSTEFKRLCPFA